MKRTKVLFQLLLISIYIIFLITILLFPPELNAQFLLLKNNRSLKYDTYYKGDEITYMLKDYPDVWKSGKIDSIYNTFFICNDNIVPLQNILEIKIDRKSINHKSDGLILMIAGPLLMSVSVINDFLNHRSPHITTAESIAFPAMFVTGFVLLNTTHKICMIGKKYSLEIIPLSTNK